MECYGSTDLTNNKAMPHAIFEGTMRYIKKCIAFAVCRPDVLFVTAHRNNKNIPDTIK